MQNSSPVRSWISSTLRRSTPRLTRRPPRMSTAYGAGIAFPCPAGRVRGEAAGAMMFRPDCQTNLDGVSPDDPCPKRGGRHQDATCPTRTAAALERTSRRSDFTGPDKLELCNVLGRTLDPSALRRRYRRAQDTAELRPLRWRDLRHTYAPRRPRYRLGVYQRCDGLQRPRDDRALPARPAGIRAGGSIHPCVRTCAGDIGFECRGAAIAVSLPAAAGDVSAGTGHWTRSCDPWLRSVI